MKDFVQPRLFSKFTSSLAIASKIVLLICPKVLSYESVVQAKDDREAKHIFILG